MDRLQGATELLDGPLDDPADLAANLRDLRRLNRLTGGGSLSVRAVRAVRAPDPGLSRLLDVGCGGCDIPVLLLADARRHGDLLEVTATDSRPEVLAAARAVRPGLDRVGGLEIAVADGLALPYADGSFDIAHTSLVVHHLPPGDALGLLRELLRVARSGIVVNDLDRSWPTWLGAWLLAHTVARSPYTRHDGPLSVRRAYTREEMIDLIREAGGTPIASIVGFARHRYAIAAR
ncbi:MAG TPA: methyltransferase domain-containing protein [Candidatus Limnocylindrales bacterium]